MVKQFLIGPKTDLTNEIRLNINRRIEDKSDSQYVSGDEERICWLLSEIDDFEDILKHLKSLDYNGNHMTVKKWKYYIEAKLITPKDGTAVLAFEHVQTDIQASFRPQLINKYFTHVVWYPK